MSRSASSLIALDRPAPACLIARDSGPVHTPACDHPAGGEQVAEESRRASPRPEPSPGPAIRGRGVGHAPPLAFPR